MVRTRAPAPRSFARPAPVRRCAAGIPAGTADGLVALGNLLLPFSPTPSTKPGQLQDRRTQSAIHFETSIVAQHGPRLVSAHISVRFSVGLEIAVALDNEVLGSPLKHLGSVANSHAARICDRASLRQRVVWAEGQTVLLQPMQVELPRLREQSCGTGRRRKPLGSR